MTLRVHAISADSRVNGPGRRSVLHLQGCTLGCPACFNPLTHAADLGSSVSVDDVVAQLMRGAPDGITISGGEPFQQAAGLVSLLRALRESGADSVLVFSGYTLAEIDALRYGPDALALIDVLAAGRYDPAVHVESQSLLASANQRLHFLTDRHDPGDVDLVGGNLEITIRPDGSVAMTGFPPPAMRRLVRDLS